MVGVASPSLLAEDLPGTLYVAPDGDDHADCASVATRCRTIQRALDLAGNLDEVRVAAGTYTAAGGTVATIGKTVTLWGGWNERYTTRDPAAYPTILDGQGRGRVVYIHGSIYPTIDGFIIRGGNAVDEEVDSGHGGGVLSRGASPQIRHNTIISNVAAITPTRGVGGGIFLTGGLPSARIIGNEILSNTASVDGLGSGGGLYLGGSKGTVKGNLIQGNQAGFYGGGVYIWDGAPEIVDNEVRGNVSGRNGGGIYGRSASAAIRGNLIRGNATGRGWHGGGVMIKYGQPIIDANWILANRANDSAGLALQTAEYFTVTNNVVADNDNDGIRLWERTQRGLIAHNTIAFNGGQGGIDLHYAHISPTIVNNIIVSNTYGIRAHALAAGTLDCNNVWGNSVADYDLPGALEAGPRSIQADPNFVDIAGRDLHLQVASPAVNVGMAVPVTRDLDGQPRPLDGGYDLGADEVNPRYISLPLLHRP
jgi:parallel beta-helix repeat protein